MKQNNDAHGLTVAFSIAAKNIGQSKLLDEVRNRFRLLHSSKGGALGDTLFLFRIALTATRLPVKGR